MTGIEKMQIETNQPLIHFLPDFSSESSRLTSRSSGKEIDQVELTAAYQKYIQLAGGEEQNSQQKVLEARQAIKNGRLDSPQSARQAAEFLVQFGI